MERIEHAWVSETRLDDYTRMGAWKAKGYAFPSLTLWVRPKLADFAARPRYAYASPCLASHCAYCSLRLVGRGRMGALGLRVPFSALSADIRS